MTSLVLVDFQTGLSDPARGPRNNPDAEMRAGELLAAWRARGWPVFHVRHASVSPNSPLRPDQPGFAFHPAVQPGEGEPVLTKSVNSGFIGTDLEARLHASGSDRVVICGLTTPHCVSTTVRMAANLGFMVTLVADACAANTANADSNFPGAMLGDLTPELIHQMAIAHLNGEFCTVVTTASLLASLPV